LDEFFLSGVLTFGTAFSFGKPFLILPSYNMTVSNGSFLLAEHKKR